MGRQLWIFVVVVVVVVVVVDDDDDPSNFKIHRRKKIYYPTKYLPGPKNMFFIYF